MTDDANSFQPVQGIALLKECSWPKLSVRYDRALRTAISYILEHYEAQGIVVSGSIIRGNPDSASDFDTYVIHARAERQRIQRFFAGVPTEIFLNPPTAIRRYFRDEQKSARPGTAHMLTTGFVILDRDPIVRTLIHEAEAALAKRPALSEQELTQRRYGAADCFENAVDIAQSNPVNALKILHQAVELMLDYHFYATNQWLPRTKELLAGLSESRPDLGRLATQFYQETNPILKFQIGEALAQRILGVTGFFEWESDPETVVEE